MTQRIGTFISHSRKFLPLVATITLFFLAYGLGATFYPGMRDPQIFLNLFRTSPFLLISAVGMTFVILTGGIDLSVSGVVALTTVASAALLRTGKWDPWVVMGLMLLMGMAFGVLIGAFITYLKVQPFIATLAGMWVARGLCFFISDDAIPIDNRIYRILGQTKLLIPGLADPVTKQGDFISLLVVLEFVVLAAAIYLAHYTRFGRTVYAIGGNEQSARLMGLPVNATKMLVYTLNGFCSALAGITLSIYVMSGHGLYARGFEMSVIASVVIGGTMLTGGVGYVFGTLFGVLVTGIIQTLIQFNGQLSSWWTNIVVGILMLIFIGIQSFLAARKSRHVSGKEGAEEAVEPTTPAGLWYTLVHGGWKPKVLVGAGALAVLALIALAVNNGRNGVQGPTTGTSAPTQVTCQAKPFRHEDAALFIQGGAVIVYERNGGPNCIDELYAIYPDGRIVGNDGENQIEEQATPEAVAQLLAAIIGKGWFTDEMYSTWHVPCGQCFTYYITVSDQGQEKTIHAVDGGTDAPADYWQVVSVINGVIPKFDAP